MSSSGPLDLGRVGAGIKTGNIMQEMSSMVSVGVRLSSQGQMNIRLTYILRSSFEGVSFVITTANENTPF